MLILYDVENMLRIALYKMYLKYTIGGTNVIKNKQMLFTCNVPILFLILFFPITYKLFYSRYYTYNIYLITILMYA